MKIMPGTNATFRHFRSEADLPGIATVVNRSVAADRNRERITAEELANIYAHPINWDPLQDTLLVEIEGTLIGYANTEWRVEDGGACLHLIQLYLLAEWRGCGLELGLEIVLLWSGGHAVLLAGIRLSGFHATLA